MAIYIAPMWKAFALVVVLATTFFVVTGLFNIIDWQGMLGLIPTAGALNIETQSTYTQFPLDMLDQWDPGHYLLERDGGSDATEINAFLQSKQIAFDCTVCSSCSGLDTSTQTADECSSCSSCDGKSGTFNSCMVCSKCTGTACNECVGCDDTNNEPEICSQLKACVRASGIYGEETCDIAELPRSEDTVFNPTVLHNVIKQCKSEMLMLNMGEGKEQQLCYFDTTNANLEGISQPSRFYISERQCKTNFLGTSLPSSFTLDGTACQPASPSISDWGSTALNIFLPWLSMLLTGGSGISFAVAFDVNDYPIFVKDETGELTENIGLWVATKAAVTTEVDIPVKAYIKGGSKNGLQEIGSIHLSPQKPFATAWITFPEEWLGESDADLFLLDGVLLDFAFLGTGGSSMMDFTSIEIRQRNPLTTIEETDALSHRTCNLRTGYYSEPLVVYDSWSPTGNASSSRRGNVRIAVSDVKTAPQRNCIFKVDVCNQDAFLENTEESIGEIAQQMRNWNPQNPHKTVPFSTLGITIFKYHLYNYYEFDLDKAYTTNEIAAALQTGMSEWEATTAPYLAAPEGLAETDNAGPILSPWTIKPSSITYSNDCWYADLQGTDVFFNFILGPTMLHNCPSGLCSGKLKVRVAWLYQPVAPFSPSLKNIMPQITFCSSG